MPSLAQSQEQVYPQELALRSLYRGPRTEPEGPKLRPPFLQEHFMQDLLRMKEGFFLGMLWSHIPEHPPRLTAIPRSRNLGEESSLRLLQPVSLGSVNTIWSESLATFLLCVGEVSCS